MALFLERIIGCGCALDRHFFCLDLKWLLRLWCRNQLPLYDNRCADIDLAHFIIVCKPIRIYDLNRLEKCTVVHNDKSEILGITVASHPASDRDHLILILRLIAEYVPDIY